MTVRQPVNRRRVLRGLWAKSGGICALCLWALDPKKLDIDHIVPVSMGGSDDESNLQVVHHVCNIRKGNRPMAEAVIRIRTMPVVRADLHGKTVITFHMPRDLFDRLEDWRFENRFGSRAAAIKQLLDRGLDLVDSGEITVDHR